MDNKLLEQAYRKYCHRMILFATKLTGSYADAEDIVGDVFMKLAQDAHTDQIRDMESVIVWSVKNKVLDFMKMSKRREERYKEVISRMDQPVYIESQIIRSEVIRLLIADIQSLPPVRRAIFKMKFLEDMDNNEIAAKFNISTDTVRVQLKRALDLLKQRRWEI